MQIFTGHVQANQKNILLHGCKEGNTAGVCRYSCRTSIQQNEILPIQGCVFVKSLTLIDRHIQLADFPDGLTRLFNFTRFIERTHLFIWRHLTQPSRHRPLIASIGLSCVCPIRCFFHDKKIKADKSHNQNQSLFIATRRQISNLDFLAPAWRPRRRTKCAHGCRLEQLLDMFPDNAWRVMEETPCKKTNKNKQTNKTIWNLYFVRRDSPVPAQFAVKHWARSVCTYGWRSCATSPLTWRQGEVGEVSHLLIPNVNGTLPFSELTSQDLASFQNRGSASCMANLSCWLLVDHKFWLLPFTSYPFSLMHKAVRENSTSAGVCHAWRLSPRQIPSLRQHFLRPPNHKAAVLMERHWSWRVTCNLSSVVSTFEHFFFLLPKCSRSLNT